MTDSVEILLATYNGAAYIAEQIDSILAQDYPHVTITIRDDGSTDRTPSILAEYQARHPERMRVLPTTRNLGILANFAHLLDRSTARYVMFSDQDDVWKSTKISQSLVAMKVLESRHGQDRPLLVHTDLSVVDEHLRVIHDSYRSYTRLDPHKGIALNRLLTQNAVTGCTILANRPLVALAAPIPKTAVMHDWWLALVAAVFGAIGYIAEPTILYRQHQSNSVGAIRYGVADFLMRFASAAHRERLHRLSLQRKNQTQAFLERYESVLDATWQRTLRAYLQVLSSKSHLEKRYLFLKHAFYRSGVLSNLFSLVFTNRI